MLGTVLAALPRGAKEPLVVPDIPLVEYRGQLPRQAAEFLENLSEWDRPAVYPLIGRFEEVRSLLGGGRLLHHCLKEGPHTAARGRITFQEFMDEKEQVHSEILAFRRRLNSLAERLHVRLPRVPESREVRHAA
jgi:hypothetical protein